MKYSTVNYTSLRAVFKHSVDNKWKKNTQSGKTHNNFTNTAVLSSNFTRVAAVAQWQVRWEKIN